MTTRTASEQLRSETGGGAFSATVEGAPTVNGRSISRQRLLGAYYTPDAVAEVLVRWALDGAPGRLLDPSFGGCAFLEAGARVMEELGSKAGGAKVFGVDVDADCIQYVRSSSRLRERNCTFEDFLALAPSDLSGAPFRAIVGNPPYVRHHWVKDEKRTVARRIADESSVVLAETASLWAYFVVHALAFMAEGGRLALLVPEAVLQADYADAVRSVLESSFRRVRLVHLRERLFDDTDEPVVVVAGEGFGEPGKLSVHSLDTAAELEALLRGVEVARPHTTLANGRRVLPEALKAVELVQATGRTIRFDELATTRIGIVTGANSHFIRSAKDLENLGVPARARTGIVSRTKWLSGLEFTKADHQDVVASGSRAFLVRPTPAVEEHAGVLQWVAEGEEAGVHEHHKCAKREPWFRVDLPPRPDAFVTSTRLGPPLLVLNRTSYRCTNALYAVRLNLEDDVSPESIALGFLTTFVALWSELNGRRYGGGVLKLDLGTLGKLPLPVVPECSSAFADANAALREGNENQARLIADRAVLQDRLGLSKRAIESMRRAHQDLVRQRIPDAKGS
jgi:adenine-specific DNA methylase